MQYLNTRKAIGLILALAFFIGGTHTALAVGTASGTPISNTATVDYDVAGDARSASGSDTGFVVDNKVDLTVVSQDGANIIATSGGTDQVLEFLVTNTGNTAQGYQFNFEPLAPTVMTNVRIYVDDPVGGTPGTYDGSDPQYIVGTTGNFANLAAISAAFGGGAGLDHDNGTGLTEVTVFIVADTAAAATNGQTEAYNLLATTLDASTDTVTDGTVAQSDATVEAVFADAAGTYTGDAAEDGTHSDTGTYEVQSAVLGLAKSVLSVTDGFGGSYYIPGAEVEYQIRVTNSGPGTVDNNTVVVNDPIPTNTKLCVDVACGGLPAFVDGATTSSLTAAAFEYSIIAAPNECADASFVGYVPTTVVDGDGANPNITCVRQAPTGIMAGSGGFFDIRFFVVIE